MLEIISQSSSSPNLLGCWPKAGRNAFWSDLSRSSCVGRISSRGCFGGVGGQNVAADDGGAWSLSSWVVSSRRPERVKERRGRAEAFSGTEGRMIVRPAAAFIRFPLPVAPTWLELPQELLSLRLRRSAYVPRPWALPAHVLAASREFSSMAEDSGVAVVWIMQPRLRWNILSCRAMISRDHKRCCRKTVVLTGRKQCRLK